MSITTYDGLVDALGNNSELAMLFKSPTVSNQVANGWYSYWSHAGMPIAPSAPTAAAICSKATSGALINFADLTGADRWYLANVALGNSVANNLMQIHDRLAHMGGLSGTVTTSQTVDLDVTGSGSNMAERRGDSDYLDVAWWCEFYAAIGATAQTLTITYTNAGGVAGQTLAITVGNTTTNGRYPGQMRQLVFPGGCQLIESAQLGGSTGTAGNFGFTATRLLTSATTAVAQRMDVSDWAALGFPRVHDHACLQVVQLCSSTASGVLFGALKMVRG